MHVSVSLSGSTDCFIALPLSMAQSLHSKSVRLPLAFQLKWIDEESDRTKKVYVGWAGSASSTKNSIEIGIRFANGIGLASSENGKILLRVSQVEITPVTPKIASTIQIEPISEDDWEIMESNAGYLEEQILNQISVIYDEEHFPLHIHHKTVLNLRVVGIQPQTKECLLLQKDVELIVTPKPRKVSPDKKITEDSQPDSIRSCLLKVQPGRVSLKKENDLLGYIHPETLQALKWKPGNIISVTALQENFSFANVDKQMRQENSNQDNNIATKILKKFKTVRLEIQESSVVSPLHIVLPIFARVECQIEERTRILARFVAANEKQLKNPLPEPKDISDEIQQELLSPKKLINLGAFQSESEKLNSFLLPILCPRKEKLKLFNLPIPPLAIISGKHGSGKSALIQSTLQQFFIAPYFVYYNILPFDTLLHRNIHTLQRYISESVRLALLNQPSIIIFENIEAIVTTDQQGEHTLLSEQLCEFLVDIMNNLSEESQRIAFILTTTSISTLHKSIRSSNITNIQIELQAPTQDQRIEIFQALAERKNVNIQEDIIPIISKKCEGYLPADLVQLFDRAIHQYAFRTLSKNTDNINEVNQITSGDFFLAQESYTPASLKGIKFVTSEKTWEDIGAMEDVKVLLKETFEWPTRYEKLFSKIPLKLRRGLLLYGPPGCGKTLIASAVAKECNLNFISVKGPELLNKYIGASEQAVRDLFEQAAAAKPCILFFDEFDSIAPRRGHDNTGVTDRVVNQLLTQLDGVESISSVYVLAATSRPDLIDPALLRPGRLDKCVYCGIPDVIARENILKAVSRKVTLAPDVSLLEIAEMTEGYTGADLHALIHNAQLEVVHTVIEDQKESLSKSNSSNDTNHYFNANMKIMEFGNTKMNQAEKSKLIRRMNQFSFLKDSKDNSTKSGNSPLLLVTQSHIKTAFQDLRPSVSPAEKNKYEAIYADFLSSRGAGALPGTGLQKATQA